jgi:glycerol-3-phosphate dehydrogenase (NAD(P)+)
MEGELARTLAILGAGSWGTALAVHLARAGRPCILWGRDRDQMITMARTRSNPRYLPQAIFPEALRVEPDLARALEQSQDLLMVVPSHAFRTLLNAIAPSVRPGLRLAWATKGFELDTGFLPHQIATQVLGADLPCAVLSGPTFASEVGRGLPTAMTVASPHALFATDLSHALSGDNFRAYTSSDMVGVEVGGAVKNVLAIAAGISDGLGFGANTRIALITRGLVEMTRLAVALGGHKETLMGLAGLGDLVLTCTDDQSRNRRMGLALASGQSPNNVQTAIGQVVEGVRAAQTVRQVAARARVEMPLCEQVYRVLHTGLSPQEAVRELMSRSLKPET